MWKPKGLAIESVQAGKTSSHVVGQEGERLETHPHGSRRRLLTGVGLLAVLVAVFALRLENSREYWELAQDRGTFFPSGWPGDWLFVSNEPSFPNFDYSQLAVPRKEILHGGVNKDGIAALTDPRLISSNEASYLEPDDRVIGVVIDNEARAYPLRILAYHEIVNETIGTLPVAVTYCPLCDSAAVFDRRTPLGTRDFGVSGRLYNSNVLMYDRGGEPESLWSQLKAEGVTGPAVKKPLKPLPLELTTWSDWRVRYPMTKVLWAEPGRYSRNRYASYFARPDVTFPLTARSDALLLKEPVLGLWTSSTARAYPESAFSLEQTRITDQLDGKSVVIEYNPEAHSFRVVEADEGVHWMYSFWFAWYAFHPESDVYGQESE